MLHVGNLLVQIALTNESLVLSDVDWFAVRELTECLKPVYDTTTAIQRKKLTAGEFSSRWLKCKVQLQHKSVRTEQCFFFGIRYASCHKTYKNNFVV